MMCARLCTVKMRINYRCKHRYRFVLYRFIKSNTRQTAMDRNVRICLTAKIFVVSTVSSHDWRNTINPIALFAIYRMRDLR